MRALLSLALIFAAGTAVADPATGPGAPMSVSSIPMPKGAAALHFDESTRRLYVSTDAGIAVFDDKAIPVGDVPVAKARSLVLALPLRHGYALEGTKNTVAVFDLATGKILEDLGAGVEKPQTIAFEPRTTRLAVFGQDETALLDVVGRQDDKSPLMFDLGGVTEAVADGSGQLFAVDGTNEVAVIDAKRGSVARWALPSDCGGATALALDDKDSHLFVACKTARLVSLDSQYGRAETMLELAAPALALAYDTGAGRLFALGRGSLTEIGAEAGSAGNAFTILATMPIDGQAVVLTLDQQGKRLFTLVPNPDAPGTTELQILSDSTAQAPQGSQP